MTTPQPAEDLVVQAAAGLAETPLGQRVAVIITVLLPKDGAVQLADAVKTLAGQLSSSGLVVANGTPPIAPPGG